jgi:hypothetical protein
MRIAAKLRGGGPILQNGLGTMGVRPGHRHLGSSSAVPSPGLPKWLSCCPSHCVLCSRCRTQDDAPRQLARRNEVPESDEQLARQRHDHGLASAAPSVGRSQPKPLGQGAVLWNLRKRQANWIMPHRTRALPARARPRSRRRLPLSSGEPVRPAYRATALRSRSGQGRQNGIAILAPNERSTDEGAYSPS